MNRASEPRNLNNRNSFSKYTGTLTVQNEVLVDFPDICVNQTLIVVSYFLPHSHRIFLIPGISDTKLIVDSFAHITNNVGVS